jgi:DNA-binding MarR family transcriptional regulator
MNTNQADIDTSLGMTSAGASSLLAGAKTSSTIFRLLVSLEQELLPAVALLLKEYTLSFEDFILFEKSFISGDSPTMSDIAKAKCFTTAAATGFAEKMEKLDIAVRKREHPENRKKVSLCLTRKGIDMIVAIRGVMQQKITELVLRGGVSEEDVMHTNIFLNLQF